MLALSPYLRALAPTILIIGLAMFLLPMFRKDSPAVRAALFIIGIILSWRYMAWRFTDTLAPAEFSLNTLLSWSFALLEAGTILSSTIAFIVLSRTRDRRPEADRHAAWWKPGPEPMLDILIATYNEEEAILERTIAGALAVRHGRKRVWVLDDGRRPWLAELCERMGARHLTRADNAHAKAGNINAAFNVLRALEEPPDFIAVLDADFVPHRDFAERTLALFHDTKVGLVQTPQHFFNADPIQNNLGIGRAYPDEQRFFFDHIQPARDAWGIAFCCGTSSVMRWEALERIGGFPTGSVTEDYLITIKLQEIGWSTVYLNEPLTEGLAPEGLGEYITQRGRWCLGLMQIVRGPLGPFSRNAMRLIDRIGMADSFLYWATTYPFRLACLIMPLLYWYFGFTVVYATVPDVLLYFMPYYAAVLVALNHISGGLVVPILNDVSQILGAREITKAVVIGITKPKGHKFKVTAKGGDRSRIVVQWPLIKPLLTLFVLTLVGLFVSVLSDLGPTDDAGDGKIVILFWSFYNLAVLAVAMVVCIELPGGSSRINPTVERTEVWTGQARFGAWVADLTAESIMLRGGLFPPEGQEFEVEIGGVGRVRARVDQLEPGGCTAQLLLTPEERQRVLAKLYTQVGAKGTTSTSMAGLLSGVARRAMRP
ncbi:glycosyltransferase [Roseomonas sp. SSH11]|uniref:Glycosyltransferase n=1 Tax=Pararoseomonas baculiformis TaxID=2820812 RepID=A0ABS4AE57_9PROT|nr:cellulose synthase catalytic subunit [Pararoseomonas baculiformis]MBP0445280.1 glycosyltransferase [Pararoseomonas baculiformis]